MIEIRITDPHTEAASSLRAIAEALLAIAGGGQKASFPVLDDRRSVGGPVQGNGAQGWKIAPNDSPDVGADVDPEPSAAQVFGQTEQVFSPDPEPSAAQVFGAGNVGAASATASFPIGVSSDAASMTTSATGPAAANGEQGNAPGATFLTRSGTPAAPNSGAAMGGVDVDSRGLPWDVRIHASTRTKNADGSWKKKPKVDPAVVAQVETELRAVMAIPAPGNAPRIESAETATLPIDPAVIAQARAMAGAPATPPASAVPPPPPASAPLGNVPPPPPPGIPTPPASPATTAGAAVPKIMGFHQLLPAVTSGLTNGTITEEQVKAALAAVGTDALPKIAPRPDLVQAVAAMLFPGQ